MTQLSMLEPAVFSPAEVKRLTGNLLAVYSAMENDGWLTRAEIRHKTGMSPDADVTRYIRFLREDCYGGHTVEKRNRDKGKGITEYRLLANRNLQVQYRMLNG